MVPARRRCCECSAACSGLGIYRNGIGSPVLMLLTVVGGIAPLVIGSILFPYGGPWDGVAKTICQISPAAMLPAVFKDGDVDAQPVSLASQCVAIVIPAVLLRYTSRQGLNPMLKPSTLP